MTDERFASRVRQALNHNLDDIPPTALRRLEAARHIALSRQKVEVMQVALAGKHSHHHGFDFGASARFRQMMAALALLVGMGIAAYWHADDYILGLEEVDSAVLTDELPPEAFLDKGFSAWLQDDSSEE